jgi:2-dehydro-3-deoxyphosphogluconate aldolase/(4S)-4-hydroxy-2-oxoglutarate aldolase
VTPDTFVSTLWAARAVAILRTDDQKLAADAMQAAIAGGLTVVEFTLGIPGVFELIAEFSRRRAGTVLTVEQAQQSVEAGAQFLVSPVVDEAVITAGQRLGVATLPGTFTPTEMLRAYRAGAEFCKLFPGPPGGPDYVRAVLGPLPFLRLVPTNGVTAQNAAAFLQAGAFAVGCVRSLFPADALATHDMHSISTRARELQQSLMEVQRSPHPPSAPQTGE